MTPPTPKQTGHTPLPCPECGKQMQVGYDRIALDYYAQCRNQRCSFDGWTGDTIEELHRNNPSQP